MRYATHARMRHHPSLYTRSRYSRDRDTISSRSRPSHFHEARGPISRFDRPKTRVKSCKIDAQKRMRSAGLPAPTGAGRNVADTATSISAHGIARVSFASGCERSIRASSFARKSSWLIASAPSLPVLKCRTTVLRFCQKTAPI